MSVGAPSNTKNLPLLEGFNATRVIGQVEIDESYATHLAISLDKSRGQDEGFVVSYGMKKSIGSIEPELVCFGLIATHRLPTVVNLQKTVDELKAQVELFRRYAEDEVTEMVDKELEQSRQS
jgi:molybdopterin synthase catalytic subunit